MSSITPRHQAALDFAAAGIPVFPTVSDAAGRELPVRERKKPACGLGGFHLATTDPEQINAWWAQDDHNVAFSPHVVGWCVVDYDHGEMPRGVPETYTVSTPNGTHLYFTGEVPTRVRLDGKPVDTRGVGSYVLVPPSIVNGKHYEVSHECDLAPVPEWVSTAARRSVDTRQAHSDIDLDSAAGIARAIAFLVARPEAVQDHGCDARTFEACCALRDLGLSDQKTFEVMIEHYKCSPKDHRFEDFIARKVANAFEYGQNEPGVDAVGRASDVFAGALDKLPDDTTEPDPSLRFFPRGMMDAEYDPGVTPTTLSTYMENEHEPPPLETIVENWLEKGITVALAGIGGTHKSRLLLQLALCLLHSRNVLNPGHVLHESDRSFRASHVEILSYENSEAETQRRITAMKHRLKLRPEQRSGTMNIWELRGARTPLVIVSEQSGIRLTKFGERFLTHLEQIKGHKIVVLDSFFNACQFTGKTKVIDDYAIAVVELLDHWCALLDCTILTPFHPSRSGAARSDMGYSPAFEDRLRQTLSIAELVPKKGETVEADIYQLRIAKWNNGHKGREIRLRYDSGVLINAADITVVAAAQVKRAST